MKYMKAVILLALTAVLVSPLASASAITRTGGSSQAAQAGTPVVAVRAASGCRGYVLSITKPGSYVQLRAMVSCDRVVDEIRVKAFITRGEGNRYSDFVTCKARSSCSATVTHPDKSGSQKYWGGLVAGNLPPATVVWDNGSTWYCGNGLSCEFGTAYY